MNPSGQKNPRGRARGRARGIPPQQQGGPAQGQQGQRGPPGPDRPGGLQERGGAAAAAQISSGMQAMSLSSSDNGASGNGNGGNGRPVGRGVMRGKRELVPQKIVQTRPSSVLDKSGKFGQSISLLANYFSLQKKKDWRLCLYHVDFNPDEDRTGLRKYLLRQHEKYLGKGVIFDGMQLYTSTKLANPVTELTSKEEKTGQVFKLTLKLIKELDPNDVQFIQVLNILLHRCQDHMGLTFMGRNYYNSKAETQEQQYGIRIWPGFSTAIRQFEKDILLNLDVTHKFLRMENILSSMKSGMRKEKLLGCIVMTAYNNKTYRIDDIDEKRSPNSTFPYRGGEMRYADYYLQKYNIKVQDMSQPLLMSKPKKRDIRRGLTENIYLIPELCIPTGLSDDMRSDFTVMRNLAQYMRMAPDRRVMALKQFNTDLAQNSQVQSELKEWGLKLEPELVKVQGRVLPVEDIFMGGKTFKYEATQADWSRNMRNVRMNTPVDLKNWACIFPERSGRQADDLVQNLNKVAGPLGMNMSRPQMMPLRGDLINHYTSQLEACAGMQIVLLVLPNNRGDRYGAIKKKLSCSMGIPSQCVLFKTIAREKGLMSVATKVAIQMNCKLGGDVWNLKIPMGGLMVIGYDTYHDSSKKGSSYGAVVSSLNDNQTKYFGQVARHSSNEELTNNFAASVRRSLEVYMSQRGMAPKTVIVYRDGVGDGQIAHVKDVEVEAIYRCFENLEHKPQFAFTIVSKRINTRLFFNSQRGPSNPPPGTVVDSVITLPERYDFFLISQSVNQGTVSPTSFNVIEDRTRLQPDHMQRLAYKLTHLYYNWQGTVRVPAPCLYAHKLAYISGTAIHDQPHQRLADKLWYL